MLTAESPGMQKYEGNVGVQVGQSLVIDPTLQPAGTATTVEVKDVTPLVTTDNAMVGAGMERTRIEQLPINGRSIVTLVNLLPGPGEPARVRRTLRNHRIYSGRRAGAGTPLGQRCRRSAWKRVQEFRVDMNAVSAKYSRPTNVILSTKSGTNQIHGSAFETARNSAIGVARRRQDTFTKAPPLNRHEYGFSLGRTGGHPAVSTTARNRTFWFCEL